jgi:hypothetical protein
MVVGCVFNSITDLGRCIVIGALTPSNSFAVGIVAIFSIWNKRTSQSLSFLAESIDEEYQNDNIYPHSEF